MINRTKDWKALKVTYLRHKTFKNFGKQTQPLNKKSIGKKGQKSKDFKKTRSKGQQNVFKTDPNRLQNASKTFQIPYEYVQKTNTKEIEYMKD